MHEARFFKPDRDTSVKCLLCPHTCVIADGSAGRCRVRVNTGGVLYAETYGILSSLALDPIEKKPLARFHPGSLILSAGSYGCNLSCLFCQNHEISQSNDGHASHGISSAQLVEMALAEQKDGNIGIAYTYNEPLIAYEFLHDTAILAHEAGLKNVLVTNGYINPEPLAEILPYIDAMNIDLKGFTDRFYSKICGGHLDPVLATIKHCVPRCHVEVTTLVIPGLNSAPGEIDALASFLAAISPEIPLHLNRHHPDYKMAEPAPIKRDELSVLAAIARRHLHHVFCGNL